ncbi:MAG: dTDP-4-dehydrorhamnose 3,5-epimerase [Deferrisomatales bacterium]|nr:dTDP-4-dehydrorhamnose 3,5-epimerase [Deferrisomatales bacterium]
MKVTATALEGVRIVTPEVFEDPRGFFVETFHRERYCGDAPAFPEFVQDNWSRSRRGVLRGLHYQIGRPQAKLVQVVRGAIYDVAVDLRPGSPNFGKWLGVHLTDAEPQQLFVPEGFAHGFCVLSDVADVLYKCSDFYVPGDEGGLLWDDPYLGVQWPVGTPLLSEKDRNNPRLRDIPPERLPAGGGRR